MADLYTIVFIVIKTGERLVMDGVEADVEMKTQFDPVIVTSSRYGKAKKAIKPITRLDITLEMATPTQEQYNKMSEMLRIKKLYLHFQDIHPNLISGYVRNITMDQHRTTIKFDGHTIDETYSDYLAEVVTQANKTFQVITPEPESNDPINEDTHFYNPVADPGFKKKVKFKKRKATQDLKRKLTF